MRIFYVTNARLPTEKAHGLATVKLCSALAKQGVEVTIFAPWRLNPLGGSVYDYYGVERNFRICYLPSLDLLWLGFGQRFFFLIQLFSFSLVGAFWLLVGYKLSGRLRDTVIFSHDHLPLFFVSFFAPRIFYDIHHYPERTPLYMRVLKRAVGIGVQTEWKIEALGRDFGIPASRIVYWPNGTDVERFDITLSREEARAKLKLPPDKKIVLYAGSLQRWKGVETLIRAARLLPTDVLVYIVGGSQSEAANFQFLISNAQNRVVLAGQRPWAEISVWLKAADVLVLPNTGREKVSRFYTSPMKLFEYMASSRPIVASDIPSIREIADESILFFAEADDPRSFAKAIRQVLDHSDEARRRAERAKRKVRKYTWEMRAQRLLTHIGRQVELQGKELL